MILFLADLSRNTYMGRDRASTHKMDYVAQAQDILNIKGNQNCIIALVQKLQQFCWTGRFCIGKGLRLQPAQQFKFLLLFYIYNK